MRAESATPSPLYLDRRMAHMFAAAAVPLVAFLWGWGPAIALASASLGLLAAVEVARLRWPGVNRWVVSWLVLLLKPGEERRVTAATYLALASVATLLVLPMPVAGVALLYLALGDPAAALVGGRFGRHRWGAVTRRKPAHTPGKSLEGAAAFLLVAEAVALLLWAKGAFGIFWPAGVGALVAAAVEFLPLPLDDNLTVPLVSGAAMSALWVV